jgi:type I restriction enzyme S subunit
MRNISQAAIRAIRLPVPPQNVRAQILTRLERIFSSISTASRESERVADLLDRLDQTVLGKAFRGELIVQEECLL